MSESILTWTAFYIAAIAFTVDVIAIGILVLFTNWEEPQPPVWVEAEQGKLRRP
jgi:hypothetical protein